MLTAQPRDEPSPRAAVEPQLQPDQPQRVIANAAQLLSNLSQFVGVVTAPRKRESCSTTSSSCACRSGASW